MGSTLQNEKQSPVAHNLLLHLVIFFIFQLPWRGGGLCLPMGFMLYPGKIDVVFFSRLACSSIEQNCKTLLYILAHQRGSAFLLLSKILYLVNLLKKIVSKLLYLPSSQAIEAVGKIATQIQIRKCLFKTEDKCTYKINWRSNRKL